MTATDADADGSGRDRLRRWIRRRVTVDARALATLRVSLGLLVLADLALRSRHLAAHYTDHGVLPRAVLRAASPTLATASLHTLSGAAWFQAVLFVVTAAAAVALVAGYRTTLATVASLVLVASLQFRNPVVLNGGDTLLRQLLFWGCFLPLGDRWSVDAVRSASRAGPTHDDQRRASVATAALCAQVVVVYTVNAVLKLRSDQWLDGTAVRRVFSLDQFTVLLGDTLARYPAVLEAAGHAWLALVTGSVLLVVLTGRARGALAAAFVVGHLGMALTLRLGLFPLVTIAALVPFFPAGLWDRLEAARSVRRVRDYGDSTAAWLGSVSSLAGRASASATAVHRRWQRFAPAVVSVALAVMVVWNTLTLVGTDVVPLGDDDLDGSDARWSMFAPEPLDTDGWYVVPARTVDGRRVDAFHGGSVTWDRPPDLADAAPTARWRKYLTNLRYSDRPALRRAFAAHLCWRWDRRHGSDLASLRVVFVEEPTRLAGPEPTRRVTLGTYTCDSVRAADDWG